jgi:cGMP-dependent protein kinase
LQSNKIIHRDLKPENILIQNNGYLKVIDFGVAKKLTNDKDYASTIIGSVYYMSPEVILGKNYNYSVDYWSVGIILYELFYGEVPFGYGVKDPQLVYKEITEKKLVLQMDENSNNEFNTMIKGLLNKNPNKRITSLQKVKALGFYAGFDFDKIYKMKIEPPRKIEPKINEDDLSNVSLTFMNFMKNNVSSSSNELDNFMKNKEYEYFNDF